MNTLKIFLSATFALLTDLIHTIIYSDDPIITMWIATVSANGHVYDTSGIGLDVVFLFLVFYVLLGIIDKHEEWS